jgi:hypothetical protein
MRPTVEGGAQPRTSDPGRRRTLKPDPTSAVSRAETRFVYVGDLVRAVSVSVAPPPASPVLELCGCGDVRDDRLSSEPHVAMEGIKVVSHVRSRLERT